MTQAHQQSEALNMTSMNTKSLYVFCTHNTCIQSKNFFTLNSYILEWLITKSFKEHKANISKITLKERQQNQCNFTTSIIIAFKIE